MVIGRTGDGKSTLCNFMMRCLGCNKNYFSESATGDSHTHDPLCKSVNKFTIIDTPGLLDTMGIEKDTENLKKIVAIGKEIKYVNTIVLVFNAQAPRFDSGMKDAVKLLIDSFGPDVVNKMAFVFTKVKGTEKQDYF